MNDDRPTTGALDFYASEKNPLRQSRRLSAAAGAIGALVTLLTLRSGIGALVFTLLFSLLIFGLIDYLLRRQLHLGQPVVTLTDEYIASPNLSGKAKRIAWKDVAYACIGALQNTAVIEFVLRAPAAGGIRRFLSRGKPARERLPLSTFSPEDQERLFDEILRRHIRSCSAEQLERLKAPVNELREAREFADRIKALQPHTWVTYGLIAVNVLIWAATLTQGGDFARSPAEKLLVWGGNAASEVQKGEWWRLLSATFLHSGFMHLAMNMLGLYSAGVTVERIYGKRFFLLIYLASGLMGSALSLHFSAQKVVAVGASGAVFGIAGAFLVAVLQNRDRLPKMFSRQTLGGLAFFIAYALMQGFGKQGIDNAAHVGGLLGGCLAAFILPERFDLCAYRRAYLRRAAAAIAVLACATTSLAALAPTALVDQGRIAGSAEFIDRGLRQFDQGMRDLRREVERINSGEISERDADERSRTVFAPIFRSVVADLSQVALRPDDPRAPFVEDVKRMADIFSESLGMESVYDEATRKYEPIDPVRAHQLADELQTVSGRVAAFLQKSKAKKSP